MAGASLLIDCHDEVKAKKDMMSDAALLLSLCLTNETMSPILCSYQNPRLDAAIRRYADRERKPMRNTTVTEAHESAGLGAS